MHDFHSIPVIYAKVIAATAVNSKVDLSQLLKNTNINNQTLRKLSGTITINDYIGLLTNVQNTTNSPAFLIDVGTRVPMTIHGALGAAIATSPDRITALNLIKNYVQLRSYFCTIDMVNGKEQTEVIIQLDDSLARQKNSALDFILGNFLSSLMFSKLLPMEDVRVNLTREPSEHQDYYQRSLNAKIFYLQSRNSIIFNNKELAAINPMSDPKLFERAVHKCKMLLIRNVELTTMRATIELIFERLPGMLWSLPQIAKELNLSSRTLQRRLKKEGANFQIILDDWLKTLALKYLTIDNLSVESTSFLLGYTDEANFRRAFKRWHNATPSDMKDNQYFSSIDN